MAVTVRPIAEFLGDEKILRRVPQEMLPLAERRLPWTGYLGFDGDQLIGMCGFKDEPKDGAVEIAYFTFPENEGRGYATGMAYCLVDFAKESQETHTVVAHTLKEESASTTILRRLGFEFQGEVVDPEDGSVWRWTQLT